MLLLYLRRLGVADGETDFDFAKRSDGSPKELLGAVGGLRMVSGKQNELALKLRVAKVRGC